LLLVKMKQRGCANPKPTKTRTSVPTTSGESFRLPIPSFANSPLSAINIAWFRESKVFLRLQPFDGNCEALRVDTIPFAPALDIDDLWEQLYPKHTTTRLRAVTRADFISTPLNCLLSIKPSVNVPDDCVDVKRVVSGLA
jgi:hypothetical protein